MENKLKFKDKIQIYIKNQKKISVVACSIILSIMVIILIGLGLLRNNNVKPYTWNESESILKATFVGDIMMGRNVKELGERKGYSTVFDGTRHFWNESDYIVGNFESAILLESEEKYTKAEKNIHLETSEEAAEALSKEGFSVVTLANNHATDFSDKGLADTMNTLENNNIKYVGAGENLENASLYDITEVNGIKIANIGVSEVVPIGAAAGREKGGILTTTDDKYLDVIRDAKTKADLVVVNVHWGDEYSFVVSKNQKKLAKDIVDAGADIVLGSHPHVVHPIELYEDSIIFYSLGNFVFDQGWSRTKDSMLVNYSIDKNGQGNFEIVPLRINEGTPTESNNWFLRKRLFRQLTKRMDKSEYTIEDNKLIIRATNIK